eukprot:364357-Chlamydomonas_euryale.AAC.1
MDVLHSHARPLARAALHEQPRVHASIHTHMHARLRELHFMDSLGACIPVRSHACPAPALPPPPKGELRYMDSLEEEQRRGITMKSSSISLLYVPGAATRPEVRPRCGVWKVWEMLWVGVVECWGCGRCWRVEGGRCWGWEVWKVPGVVGVDGGRCRRCWGGRCGRCGRCWGARCGRCRDGRCGRCVFVEAARPSKIEP